jgi:hypothetical protein
MKFLTDNDYGNKDQTFGNEVKTNGGVLVNSKNGIKGDFGRCNDYDLMAVNCKINKE